MIDAIQPDESLPADLARPDPNNATIIFWQELNKHLSWETDFVPLNKKRWYQKLDRYNNGECNGDWENVSYHRKKENWAIITTLVDQLELTDDQTRRALGWFTNFRLGKWGLPKELVAYCLCACIVHSDPLDARSCHPQTPREKKDDNFQRMEKALGLHITPSMGKNILDSTYAKIQRNLQSGPTPSVKEVDKYSKWEGTDGEYILDTSRSEWVDWKGGT